MPLTDRYGLPVSTDSSTALDRFQDGMDRLLSYGFGADQSFATGNRQVGHSAAQIPGGQMDRDQR